MRWAWPRPGRRPGISSPRRPGRYWVHLDVDVLDEQAFRATDYLMPGGLSLAELGELIRPLLAGPGLAGVSLACYNPQKDLGGAARA